MQTVSTKLDKTTAKKFIDICNDEGKCQSEMLRDMIQNVCNYDEPVAEPTATEPTATEPVETPEPTITISDV
jgi:hypothetical protein